ncbi:MAG: nucleotide pyrophosphohydrolase [Coriobacteriia bacterium]|nr:nucleotide pyrophosphohydrolase [Coriobacteriia bacterium]
MDFEQARQDVLAFRDERNWKQFHNPKDLAISINLEAAELLELFQWSGADTERADKFPQMREELADVLIYCIDLADRLDLDIPTIIGQKMEANRQKYPADKARNTAAKYDEL